MMNETVITKVEHRGRPSKFPTVEVFKKDYERYSNSEIAAMYGVTISTVQKMARRNGLRKSATGRPGSAPLVEELIELCKHHTYKEIPELHEVCPTTVAYWRKNAGITKYNKVS